MKDIKSALEVFVDSSIKHSEATEQGDYKKANKNYDIIINTVKFLKSEDAMQQLLEYLSSPMIGVRLWSSYYCLPLNESEALKVLEDIEKSPGILSLTAETIIDEWKKGNLKY